MKKIAYILLTFIVLSGCKKKDEIRTSGTDTISNLRYTENSTYALHGFSFSTGRYVSTEAVPGPEIIIDTVQGGNIIMMANNLRPSFSKSGDYPDQASAKEAFDNLKTATPAQWIDFTTPILPDQIWIYRSGAEKYTKFRIISTVYEKRQNLGQEINYCEVTFEWIYQPDGTLTFP